jgi:hypothetical protein
VVSNGVVFYLPAAFIMLAAVLKAVAGRRVLRDPLVLSIILTLVVGSLTLGFSAPPTIEYVNAATGVANFSAPLVYSGMTALSMGYLMLLINWRGGSPEQRRRASRLVAGVYTLVIAGLWILFAFADVPVNRSQDLDTYYANTPCMREMIMLYMVAHTVATLLLMAMCLTWLREVRGVTRTGLTLMVVGLWFDMGYQAAKYTAIAARWAGVDWDHLSTYVSPPLVMVAGVVNACGMALPRLGPPVADNVRALWRFWQLRPLSRELGSVRAPATGVVRWWNLPVTRLARRQIAVWDGVLACSNYLDDDIRTTAYCKALTALTADPEAGIRARTPAGRLRTFLKGHGGASPSRHRYLRHQAAVIADAAMLAAARVKATSRAEGAPVSPGTLKSVDSTEQMAGLARAIAHSPIVAEARLRAENEAAVAHD